MTSKTYGEALDRLQQISQLTDRAAQLQQLRQLVLEVSAAPPAGSIGVLWSGKFRPPGARFDGLDASLVAKELQRLNPNFVLVNDTDVGRLLDSDEFENALFAAVGGNRTEFNRLLGSAEFGMHTNGSFWATASDQFVRSLRGSIITLVGNADPDRIFALVEVQAALANRDVTHLAGIPTDFLRTRPLDEAFRMVKGAAAALSAGLAVSAEIKTGRRRIIEFLLSPLQRRVEEAGRER